MSTRVEQHDYRHQQAHKHWSNPSTNNTRYPSMISLPHSILLLNLASPDLDDNLSEVLLSCKPLVHLLDLLESKTLHLIIQRHLNLVIRHKVQQLTEHGPPSKKHTPHHANIIISSDGLHSLRGARFLTP
ncbi:hypothetical protein MN608_02191 [Microdochium nivale]|nr:hypothetical protein MN608_02191 [Microdochium nivale]